MDPQRSVLTAVIQSLLIAEEQHFVHNNSFKNNFTKKLVNLEQVNKGS